MQKEIQEMEMFQKDLAKLIAIPSIRDETTKQKGTPFGTAIAQAMTVFGEIAKRLDFIVAQDDGYAMHAQLGEGEDYIGVLGHLDVVDVKREDWHSDPFQLQERDGIWYGRGVNDDKGPLLAALYAAARIKAEGCKLKHPIRIIAGGAEETTWECMEHYFQHYKQPLCGFSPDGNFPIVNGEKGILQVRFLFPADKTIKITSSPRVNYVCERVDIEISGEYQKADFPHADEWQRDKDGCKLTYLGKTALSRNPQRGENALFTFAKDAYGKLTQQASFYTLVKLIYEVFLDDMYGEKSGLYHEDADMGKGSVCIMSCNSNCEEIELCVDIRYVKGIECAAILERLRQLSLAYGCDLEIIKQKRLLYVPENSTLIQSLKTAYQRVMKEDAQVFTKGGASYARMLDHGVAFGATFPDEDPNVHMADEHMPIASLQKAMDIYYEALKELAVEKEAG